MALPHVVVLGSGFAGLETAFRLRAEVGDAVRLAVVSDSDEFLFRPDGIYLPFGSAEAKLRVPLGRAMRRRGITNHVAGIAGVDVDAGRVHTDDGRKVPYDHLVIATGAAARPDEVPGLDEHAHQIWLPSQLHDLGDALQRLARLARQGQRQRVLFTVPPNNLYPAPLYEIAFMLDTWLRRRDARDKVDIAFTTFERSFIQPFGPKLHVIASEQFLTREIDAKAGPAVTKVNERDAVFADGTTRPFDLMVTSASHAAAVRYAGLPADGRGFLHCHKASRAVFGHDEIYAPGDAGDFPVKDASLALQQASAVALDIASAVRRHPPRGGFEPISVCILDMLDLAAFARVPLQLTGNEAVPVSVDPALGDRYRAGTSVAWRATRKLLGTYLPMRFRRGLPAAGAPWRAIELGLRAAEAKLAD